MGKVYKTYKVKVHDEKNGLYKSSTLKFPENIEFLSATGHINHYFHPTFHISVLEDSHSNNLKEYEFLAIDSKIKRKVSISVDGYRYVGSAVLPFEYDDVIDGLSHFDIFVKES